MIPYTTKDPLIWTNQCTEGSLLPLSLQCQTSIFANKYGKVQRKMMFFAFTVVCVPVCVCTNGVVYLLSGVIMCTVCVRVEDW